MLIIQKCFCLHLFCFVSFCLIVFISVIILLNSMHNESVARDIWMLVRRRICRIWPQLDFTPLTVIVDIPSPVYVKHAQHKWLSPQKYTTNFILQQHLNGAEHILGCVHHCQPCGISHSWAGLTSSRAWPPAQAQASVSTLSLSFFFF